MNGSLDSAIKLIDGIESALSTEFIDAAFDVAVFPPSVHISAVLSRRSKVIVGAQNVDWRKSGAYTGEISVGMLADLGCEASLVGHSERRVHFGDTDQQVAERFAACLGSRLMPVLCVGETIEERKASRTEEVVNRQILAVVDQVGISAFSQGVVAYEPVWAIGTGESATPGEAQAVHKGIRSQLGEFDRTVSEGLRILYGGSVTGENARQLFAEPDIDGALVGGASLKIDEITQIMRVIHESTSNF